VPRRAGALVTGPALEEDEEGAVRAVRICDLAREHLDRRSARTAVVQRHDELVLGQDEAASGV